MWSAPRSISSAAIEACLVGFRVRVRVRVRVGVRGCRVRARRSTHVGVQDQAGRVQAVGGEIRSGKCGGGKDRGDLCLQQAT